MDYLAHCAKGTYAIMICPALSFLAMSVNSAHTYTEMSHLVHISEKISLFVKDIVMMAYTDHTLPLVWLMRDLQMNSYF